MWVWIAIAALFLYLASRFSRENASTTRSRPAAFVASLADSVALVLLTLGVFGMLMALVLGVFAGTGPHLAGESLVSVIIWSIALMAIGAMLMLSSIGLRHLGGKGAPAPVARRGGH